MKIQYPELRKLILTAFPKVVVEFGAIPDQPKSTTVDVYGIGRKRGREIRDIIYAYAVKHELYGLVPMIIDFETTTEFYPEIAHRILLRNVFQPLDEDQMTTHAESFQPIEEGVPFENDLAA